MSLEIYNKAKFMAEKIIEIIRIHDSCKERLQESFININSYRFSPNTVYMDEGRYKQVFIRTGSEPYHNSCFYKFDGSGTDYRHRTINKRLQRITEFDEAFDFQLMTLFNDKELFDYYYCSLIYSSGFIGYIRHGIHHNSMNTMIKHLNYINEYKDSTLYQYRRSTWKC